MRLSLTGSSGGLRCSCHAGGVAQTKDVVAQPGLPGAPSSTSEGRRFQSTVAIHTNKSDTNSIPICVIQLRFVKPDLVTNANWASTRWPCQNGKTRESIALHSKIGVRLFAPVTSVCTGYACLRSIATVTYQMAACTSYACLHQLRLFAAMGEELLHCRWITVLSGNQDIYFRANRDWLYFSESFEFNADVSQQHFLTSLVAEWRGFMPRFPTEISCPRSPVTQ